MNWRGRPLASHEVIVNTIAATTTRTGLAVHAELDISPYTTGLTISDRHMASLPITRHDWHGDGNYTLHPVIADTADDTADDPDDSGQADLPNRVWLHHPALTGLDPDRWDELIDRLGMARSAQREVALHQRRGGARRTAAGTGRKAVLTLADRAAITVLYQRFSPPQRTLAALFGITQQSTHNTIRLTRPLLAAIGYTPQPTGIRLATPADLIQHAIEVGATTPDKPDHAC
jgi:Rhodopirellula transposase DDE domain